MDKKGVDNLKNILSGKEVEKSIQVGYGDQKVGPNAKGKKPGDVWEYNGKKWTMKENGTITNVTRFDDVRIPMFCPRCESIMNRKADTKSFYSNGTCLDCMIDDHEKMRKEGKLEQFAWKKRIQSSMAWLRDQEKQFEEFKLNSKKNPKFLQSDGTFEKWSGGDINFDKIIEEYTTYLDNYRKELQNVIDEYETKYNEPIKKQQ